MKSLWEKAGVLGIFVVVFTAVASLPIQSGPGSLTWQQANWGQSVWGHPTCDETNDYCRSQTLKIIIMERALRADSE